MKVTIVIPIYKDWATLELCINSLIKYCSPEVKIVLVNDCSEEADYLEEKIKTSILNYAQFNYFRNDSNLGFVKTCNKAVFELDKTDNDILLLNSDTEVTENFLIEMYDILHSQNQHGVVCPRSNNATLLTYPTFQSDEILSLSKEEQLAVFFQTCQLLPRFHVIPTGVGFCMLIKRNLINIFGLFDEIYDKGYNEENDFCMRISQYGYSVICANHALVLHYESKSFGLTERSIRDKKNSKILNKRYPYYEEAIREYFNKGAPPVESFINVSIGKPKLLFCLYEAKAHFDGTTIYGLKLLEAFCNLYKDKYEITVLAHQSVIRFHKLDTLYSSLIQPHQLESTRYSLVFSPSQMFNWEHLKIHLKFGLKSAFTLQDIIVLRCPQLLSGQHNLKRIFYNSIKYADGIISISNFVKSDTIAYFNLAEIDQIESKTKVVHHGINLNASNLSKALKEENLFKEYVLVIGNHYKHKSLDLVCEILSKSNLNKNFVFLGYVPTFQYNSNFKFVASGNLTAQFIYSLYENAEAIIFPSQYEGFGLPIIEGLSHGKRLLLFNNEINKEVVSTIDPQYVSNVEMFDDFDSLPQLLAKENSIVPKGVEEFKYRTWNDVAVETEAFLYSIISKPVDTKVVQDKAALLNTLSDVSFISGLVFSVDDMKRYEKIKKVIKYSQLIHFYKAYQYIKSLVKKVS